MRSVKAVGALTWIETWVRDGMVDDVPEECELSP